MPDLQDRAKNIVIWCACSHLWFLPPLYRKPEIEGNIFLSPPPAPPPPPPLFFFFFCSFPASSYVIGMNTRSSMAEVMTEDSEKARRWYWRTYCYRCKCCCLVRSNTANTRRYRFIRHVLFKYKCCCERTV